MTDILRLVEQHLIDSGFKLAEREGTEFHDNRYRIRYGSPSIYGVEYGAIEVFVSDITSRYKCIIWKSLAPNMVSLVRMHSISSLGEYTPITRLDTRDPAFFEKMDYIIDC